MRSESYHIDRQTDRQTEMLGRMVRQRLRKTVQNSMEKRNTHTQRGYVHTSLSSPFTQAMSTLNYPGFTTLE